MEVAKLRRIPITKERAFELVGEDSEVPMEDMERQAAYQFLIDTGIAKEVGAKIEYRNGKRVR